MSDDLDQPNPWRRGAIRFLILLLIGVPLVMAGWCWLAMTYVYSHGERAGYIQKFSKRGWIFKTWEGEIAMVNLPGTMQEKFGFTVRNAEVAQQIEQAMGQRVSISYEQHRGIPGTFLGETQYFVTKITKVADPYQLQNAPAPTAPAIPPTQPK